MYYNFVTFLISIYIVVHLVLQKMLLILVVLVCL